MNRSKARELKDLDEGHPFYSNEAIQRWRHRIKELENEEQEWSKRRRKKGAEEVEEQVFETLESNSKRKSRK